MRIMFGTAVCAALIVLAACSSSHHGSTVPSLHGATAPGQPGSGSPSGSKSGARSGPSVGAGAGRAAALHAAAQCIRTHGVPTYQDPVLTADGHVYTDARSIQNLGEASKPSAKGGGSGGGNTVLDTIRQACGPQLTAAGFLPDDESPAPPQLVQAGVVAAR